MARPKKEPDRKNIVGVRCSDAELELLQRAVAREMEKVTGGTPSLPKYLLAAALEKARKQLGSSGSNRRASLSRAAFRVVRTSAATVAHARAPEERLSSRTHCSTATYKKNVAALSKQIR